MTSNRPRDEIVTIYDTPRGGADIMDVMDYSSRIQRYERHWPGSEPKRYWVNNETGEQEPVQQNGGWDEPPSWVRRERAEAARRKEEATYATIASALERLAGNGCDLSTLSDEELHHFQMNRKVVEPVSGTGAPIVPMDNDTILLGGLTIGGAILELDQRDGQSQLVSSQAQLPSSMDDDSRKILEKFGVQFAPGSVTTPHTSLGTRPKELFVKVTLPKGWHIQATDSGYWSDLVDDKGRNRASIFYKSAFYDRDAFLHLVRRFSVEVRHLALDFNDRSVRALVRDGTKVVHVTRVFEGLESNNEARQAAAEWLGIHWPKRDAFDAYWD